MEHLTPVWRQTAKYFSTQNIIRGYVYLKRLKLRRYIKRLLNHTGRHWHHITELTGRVIG